MKAKIESAKPGRTFQGTNGEVQVYEVVAGGVVYDCLNRKCLDLVGQEVEFEVKQASDPKYHPTMKLPGDRQAGGSIKGRFQLAFSQTAEGEKLRTKAMVLSYAKDIALAPPQTTFEQSLTNLKKAYESMIPLLQLDQIREREQQTGNGHKDLQTLLAEMKPLSSLEALSNWWKTIPEAYKALSEQDQKILVTEKDKKKAEFVAPGNSGRQPSF